MMTDIDTMMFDMDLSNSVKKKLFVGENSIPIAPPPSPSSSSKRKSYINLPLPVSKLFDCCEELVNWTNRTNSVNFGSNRSYPLHMKRKTSDSDDCCSSSSAGTSPGGSSDCACSFGKRSRSSLTLENLSSCKPSDFSLMEFSTAMTVIEN